jgi:hypothetical protein
MIRILIRYSYPKQPGDTPWSIVDVEGPTSYVQVTAGSAGPPLVRPTGGQPIFPKDFGLQSFHIILQQASQDALYRVDVIPFLIVDQSNPGGDAFIQSVLRWTVIATGAQVAAGVDLSAHSVRLLAIGN